MLSINEKYEKIFLSDDFQVNEIIKPELINIKVDWKGANIYTHTISKCPLESEKKALFPIIAAIVSTVERLKIQPYEL